jgi:hypothetical protein
MRVITLLFSLLILALQSDLARAQGATSTLCHFTAGPRAGQIWNFAQLSPPLPVGMMCNDGAFGDVGQVVPMPMSMPRPPVPTGPTAAMTTLPIKPVLQATAEWCWLATGQMVFSYYNIPPNNPPNMLPSDPNYYQCGEARFQNAVRVPGASGPAAFTGRCWLDCNACGTQGAGNLQGLINMVVEYPQFMSVVTGGNYHLQQKSSLTPLPANTVKAEIDARRPIIAGISAGEGMQPPGIAQHAVLIIGYADGGNTVIINDPWPYQAVGQVAPYLQFGGTQLQLGQYAVSYSALTGPINWRNAVYGIEP